MVYFMNKWQRKYTVIALILLFVGPLVGLVQPIFTNSPVTAPLAQERIHSSWDVGTKSALEALSNQFFSENIFINPTANITGATMSKFTLQTNSYGFYVQKNLPYVVEFSIINSTLNTNAEGFNLLGSPSIYGNNVSISGPLMSNNYPTTTIDTPNLRLTNVNASQIQLKVTGGTFIWNHSTTSAVVLNGFTTALLDSDKITKGLWVEGSGIVTILNSVINGTIHETVKPTITCPTSYLVPFAFVFQPRIHVEINLGGVDNIRGPAYGLSYNLTIEKNGQLEQTLTNVLTNTYSLEIDTAATYELHLICKDKQGNVSTETIITILPQATLLWFILMLVIIAAAVVGAIAIFLWRKQRQWQKTSLVEIPA